jgi:hypothetical protein
MSTGRDALMHNKRILNFFKTGKIGIGGGKLILSDPKK